MNDGWQIAKLGDVCEFEGGSQPPKSQFVYEPQPGYVRFLQIRDFGSDKNITYIPKSKKNRLCKNDDILIGRYGASVGKILTDKDGAYNVALMKTIPKMGLLNRSWFYHYLNSDVFQSPLLNVADRSAQAGFSKDDIFDFPVPVPPLAEQQRIVGILDEAFEGIATAKANAEKNLQNARALFESHLTEALSSVDKNWPSRPLDSLLIGARKISYGIVKPGIHDPDGVRLIKSQQVRDNSMDLTEDFRITKQLDQEYARTRLHGGEILLNLVGASIGRSAFAPAELQGANVSRAIAVIPVRPEFGRWVQYNLRCSVGQTMIQAKTGGSAQPVLNLSEVKSMEIPFPSIIEQQVIVQNLDALVTETQRLAAIYKRKLAALDDLKKSLLHQAFTGEL